MKINRRKFISSSATGFITLSGLSLFFGSSCSAIKRGDLSDDSKEESVKKKLGSDRYMILHYASLAPSPHNTQPWFVKIVTEDKWIICVDKSRQMNDTDPENFRLILGLGAFIENLVISAGTMGFEAKIEIVATGFFEEEIALVHLKKGEKKPFSLELLKSRKTVKKGYLNKPIAESDIKKLQIPLENHFFYYPMDSWHGKCIQEEAINAFQAWLDSEKAQSENVKWLRINNKNGKKYRDGLTTESMEIKGFAGFFTRLFFSAKDFAGDFMKKESMKFTKKIAKEGAGYVIVTGYGRTVEGMIEVGRRFERTALLARELNIGIQPMTQILEMKSSLKIVGSKHTKKIDPQMVLRIGYVDKYPDPVSLRRPVSWFVKKV